MRANLVAGISTADSVSSSSSEEEDYFEAASSISINDNQISLISHQTLDNLTHIQPAEDQENFSGLAARTNSMPNLFTADRASSSSLEEDIYIEVTFTHQTPDHQTHIQTTENQGNTSSSDAEIPENSIPISLDNCYLPSYEESIAGNMANPFFLPAYDPPSYNSVRESYGRRMYYVGGRDRNAEPMSMLSTYEDSNSDDSVGAANNQNEVSRTSCNDIVNGVLSIFILTVTFFVSLYTIVMAIYSLYVNWDYINS
ncbi:hypothetical protein [Candidatus Ichthyocystis sparus]|uniref:hypothetical protein n=1 Tax=Candidatus Ichthyocystis sparus TaxID=1561004 RepID=UPI000B8365ED|nr:hypothetical protein [Candidatus Ichthyocystis sparus]